MNAAGFPTANALGIGAAAGGLGDYVLTAGTPATTVSISTDATHATCAFTYNEADGTVTAAPLVANCQ